ncbi:MAG: MlaE family ABC transporter permease [Planctomycetaceae bacterium]
MASVAQNVVPRHERWTPLHALGARVLSFIEGLGDLAVFAFRIGAWLVSSLPRRGVLWPNLYEIGVCSLPVVLVTGTFIGMVLAVQSYDQFRMMHLETRLGAAITISLVNELGPVLAAVMLAGRVGSAMAAELGTMRVTEQIDALRVLGADPIHYLVVPRFLACVLLIPLLTVMADGVGIVGGWWVSTQILMVDSHHYWYHTKNFVDAYNVFGGMFKSIFFGATIAIVACHRGFHCGPGAEGVGKAATSSFVLSFLSILILDFFLGIIVLQGYYILWSALPSLTG